MSTRTSPATIQQIVVMREAGWTLASISEKTSTSISTLQRILKRNKVKAGSKEAEMVVASRAEMFDKLINSDQIRELYATTLSDNESQMRLARVKAAEALENLKCDSTADAALTMRALTAHATMLKSHSDCLRTFIPLPESAQHIPELTIHIMSAEEEKEMREEQRREDDRLAEAYMEDETMH